MEVNSNEEIDVIDLLKKLYKSRKLIIYTTTLFIIIGVANAILSPVKYNSTTVFILQNKDSSSSLSGVASLVGINLGSNSNANEISPAIYPQIINSVKFKRLLLKKIINEKDNLTLEQFIKEHYALKVHNDQKIRDLGMTKIEENYFNILSDFVKVSVNQKDGFISITSIMPDAEYAAKIAKFSREILQKIIIENKVESARQNLIFSEGQLKEKKQEFDDIYSKLAFFSDSNLNSVNSYVKNEKNKLESEFNIISAVVEELSKQVEQAKLQLNKDTPVFSTIQEAIIPIKRSSPKRRQIVILFAFFGLLFSCISVIIYKPAKDIFYKIIS